jgi:hypothetical protein
MIRSYSHVSYIDPMYVGDHRHRMVVGFTITYAISGRSSFDEPGKL